MAPKVLWVFQQVWLSLGLIVLLIFAWRMTAMTAHSYGALPAALMFLLNEVMIIYTVLLATENRQALGGAGRL